MAYQGGGDSPSPDTDDLDFEGELGLEGVGDIYQIESDGIHDGGVNQISLASFKRETWPRPSQEFSQHHVADIYEQVRDLGIPNEVGARIPITSKLKPQVWLNESTGHPDDSIVLQGVRFGFSLQYTGPPLCELPIEMHASGASYARYIQEYIDIEIAEKAMIGPFSHPPFVPWCRTSPLMTRPKSDSQKRRTIVDLSYPPGANVNEGVFKNNYYGRYLNHRLPRIDDVVAKIVDKGFSVALATVDIRRAYRNFPGCPLDLPLNVIRFEGRYYIDLAMPFGARTSSCYMQKAAEFISRALKCRGIHCDIYLDDVIMYFDPQDNPPARMQESLEFIKSFGLPLAEEKVQQPSPKVKYLGVWLDVDSRMISMPGEKIRKFLELVEWCLLQERVSKKIIQTVVGKIIHLSACVPAARTFINRILDVLRQHHESASIPITQGIIQDLEWFRKFLRKFNGKSMMRPSTPTYTIEADACLDGAGATDFSSYIAYRFPEACSTFHISILEALNCLVACRILLTKEKHSSVVKIKCDNLPTIESFSRGAAKDRYLAAISRAIWYCMARADVTPIYEYTPGELMTIPDSLSRMSLSPAYYSLARAIICQYSLQQKEIHSYHLDFHNFL